MSWHAWKVKLTVDAVKIIVDVAIRETFAVTAAVLRNHHGELLGYDFLLQLHWEWRWQPDWAMGESYLKVIRR